MSGRLWSKRDVKKLEYYKSQNKSIGEIAILLDRSYTSVSIKFSRQPKIPKSPMPKWDTPLVSEGDALILSDIEAPFQQSEFINRVLDLAYAWGIKTLHLAGDLLHYDSLSAWGSEWTEEQENLQEVLERLLALVDKKKREDGLKLLEEKGILADKTYSGEIKAARAMFRNLDGFDNVLVALGNHDDRYLRAIDQATDSTELLHQLDKHKDPRWKIAPYYYTLIETEKGTFRATHPRGAGKNTAIDLAVQMHTHIIMGHSHRWSVNRDPSGKYWCIQTGHCVDESRLAYIMQRDARRDAHVNGATIIRDGFPFVLCPETPWEMMKRM